MQEGVEKFRVDKTPGFLVNHLSNCLSAVNFVKFAGSRCARAARAGPLGRRVGPTLRCRVARAAGNTHFAFFIWFYLRFETPGLARRRTDRCESGGLPDRVRRKKN